MSVEELLHHRGRGPVSPARGQRVEDHRTVEVTLVVRGEDHRTVDLLEMLEPGDGHVREDTAEGEYPRRQARAPDRTHRQAAIPRWENQGLGSDPVPCPRQGLTPCPGPAGV